MSLALFYLPPEQWGSEIRLEGQEARHLSQVLRIGPGSHVRLMDGQGRLGHFLVNKAGKKNVDLALVDETFLPQPEARAIVALAFSKAVRRGFFMEKTVELGASGIWLWQGDHSQGNLSSSAQEACQGQLIAGAKQCGNPWLPEVKILKGGVEDLAKHAANADYRILPWEAQDNVPMLSPDMAGQTGLTVYVIGPEGGFSARELDTLRLSGFTAVSLGTRVLRCETAATLCLGIHWWASQLPKASLPEAERS